MRKYLILTIVLLSFLIYSNSLNNAFVSDDIPDILNSSTITDVQLNNFSFSSLTYAINYLIAGRNPWIYHLTNIIIHILTSIFVFLFLRIFFRRWPSFWGALLFVVHPIHTENITWISGRGHAMFGLFALISFVLYARRSVGSLIGSITFYICALFSSPFALLYPAMIVLYDFTFRKWKEHWWKWVAFFGLACFKISFMLGLLGNRVASISADVGAAKDANFIFKMAYSVFHHFWLLLWPDKLTLYHEPLWISAVAIRIEAIILGLIMLSLPFVFRKAKIIFFAICIFIIFLIPTYSPITITWLIAERYLYFPSIVLSIFLAFVIDKVHRFKVAGIILLILILSACSARTIIRNFDWRTRASIWRATVKVSPESPKAHNNMGDIHSGEGNLGEAVKSFKRAIKLKPNYADARHNLKYTYYLMNTAE